MRPSHFARRKILLDRFRLENILKGRADPSRRAEDLFTKRMNVNKVRLVCRMH